MPFPGETRRGRRLVGSMVVAVAALSLVGLASPSSYADDDYPYRGLGKCPLVPLPHPTKPPGKPGRPPKPGHPQQPGHPNGPGGPNRPPTTPPPPRECAKHIWYYQGTYGDPWGFALRNCTSFVAWRLRETNGLADFSNHMSGGSWGDARHWDNNARRLGYLVDHVPAVGAVAQTDHGRIGHVAWVSAVGEGTVTVEEYNYYVAGGYDVRTVPTSDFRYLHVADTAPAPTLGSTRAAATAVDAQGGTWTARTTSQGDLTVRRPSGALNRLGPRGSWSPEAAPSIVVDARGRVTVAAVTQDGRVLLTHTGGTSSSRWSRLLSVGDRGWSTTSTPALAEDGHGRVRLVSVSAGGDLVERHSSSRRSDGWSRGDRMGLPGSWSPQSSPAVTTDRSGRSWLVAVTRGGRLLARHTGTHGTRWKSFDPVDHRSWSVTSSPALEQAPGGRLTLASVTARGTLLTRSTGGRSSRWHHVRRVDGLWSPYASPALVADATGRLWLAAVGHDGSLVVRSTAPEGTRWHRPRTLGPAAWSVTDSPALTTSSGAEMRVAARTADGRTVWRYASGHHPALAGGLRPFGRGVADLFP
ncbi:MAG: CHAP domain-containing protein [Nocardioides sp.]